MAIDYGERRIGLAISDPTGTIASPAGASCVAPASVRRWPRSCDAPRRSRREGSSSACRSTATATRRRAPREVRRRRRGHRKAHRASRSSWWTSATRRPRRLRAVREMGGSTRGRKGRRRRARRGRVTATGAGSTSSRWTGRPVDGWTVKRERLPASLDAPRCVVRRRGDSRCCCGARQRADVRVTIPPGASMRVAADSLSRAHVISFARGFPSLRVAPPRRPRHSRRHVHAPPQRRAGATCSTRCAPARDSCTSSRFPRAFRSRRSSRRSRPSSASTDDSVAAAGRRHRAAPLARHPDADARGLPLSRHVHLPRRHDGARRGRARWCTGSSRSGSRSGPRASTRFTSRETT